MKKKMFALIAVIVLLTAAVAATVAYSVPDQRAHNVITSGYIDIDLVETRLDSEKEVPYGDVVLGLMPGLSQSKIVRIHNVGEQNAWVRAKVDVSIKTADGESLPAGVLEIDFDKTKWEEKDDGYYYYKEYLTKDGKTETPLFTQVKLKGAAGNEYQNAEIKVNVKAEAIQWQNNELEAGADIISVWPDVQILPYE